MHNGYAPDDGDVAIAIHQVPEGGITDGATAVIVAGHDGFYRRIGPRQEWWIVDIEGCLWWMDSGDLPVTYSGPSDT